VSRIKRLIDKYNAFITIPWRPDVAAAQRVIFCVYDENEELRLRARINDFEYITRQAGHEWLLFDLTDTFADWLNQQRYAKKYFETPHLLSTLLPKYLLYIVESFKSFLADHQAGENTVVALKGVGSLFGFLKVKEVVDKLAPLVTGRLLIFFPGINEGNNYRLLDAYDGWNYLAVPITADKDF